MSTPIAYRLRMRNAADTADDLVISSVPTDDYPYIGEVPKGDGSTLDPLTGQVTIGAYTVQVIDAVSFVPAISTAVALTDDLSYANVGAANAAGYTATGGVAFNTGVDLGPYTTSISLTGVSELSKDFTLTPNTTYRFRLWLGSAGTYIWIPFTLTLTSGASVVSAGRNGDTADGELSLVITTDGTGVVSLSATTSEFNGNTNTYYIAGLNIDGLTAAPETEGRIVTSHLTDSEGQQHLLSRKAYLEESTDGGFTWAVLTAGYVNRYALVDALRWEFSIGESRRIEQSHYLFERTSDPIDHPDLIGVMDRACCLVGGPVVGTFGPIQDYGRPLYEVSSIDGTVVQLKWISGGFHGPFTEFGPPVRDSVLDFINNAAADYLPGDLAFVPSLDTTYVGLSGVTARLYVASDGTWLRDLPAMAVAGNGSNYVLCFANGAFHVQWSGTLPSVGQRYKVAVFPTSISQRNPLHLTGHPMDFLAWWYELAGIAFDETSRLAVRADLGDDLVVELRPTERMTAQDACEQYVYGPFGVAPRLTDDGEFEFFRTRDPSAASVTTLTIDDLSSDAGTCFSNEEAKAANKVTLKVQGFTFTAERHDDTPLDAIRTSSVTVTVDALDPSGNAIFGDREIQWDLPGQIKGLATGTTEEPGTLDLWMASQAQPLFDWQGRGSVEGEFHVLRGADVAKIGQIVTQQFAHVPTASPFQAPTSQRGTVERRAIVLRRTRVPEGSAYLLQDRGPSDVLPVPPFFTPPIPCTTIDPVTGLAAVVVGLSVTLTWTNAADDVPVEISYREVGDTSPITVLTLPAESITATLTLPEAATEYTFSVRYREPAPRDCTSTTVTVNATTDVVACLPAPIAPAAFADGAGTYGISVTPTVVDAAVEVWVAQETAVGSGVAGTYALVGTTVSTTPRTSFTVPGRAPNKKKLVFLKAQHTKTGFTSCGFTDPVSINPWTLVPDGDPTPPVIPVAPTVLPIEIAFVVGPLPLALREIPADAEPVRRASTAKFPLDGARGVRVMAEIDYTTAPEGSLLAFQFEPAAAPGTWEYMDGASGPTLAIDETSLDLMDTNPDEGYWVVTGDWVTLRDECKGDVRFRAVILGGTDTEDCLAARLTLQFTPDTIDALPPEVRDPPVENPGSCETPTSQSLVSGWTEVEPSGSDWTIVGATRVLTLDGSGTGAATETKVHTGLTPNELYTFVVEVDTDAVAIGAFLTVGGETATVSETGGETLQVGDVTNGSGEITVVYGATAIQNAPDAAGSDDLDYANEAAANAAGFTKTGSVVFNVAHAVGAFTPSISLVGEAMLENDFALTAGATYTFRLWLGSGHEFSWAPFSLDLISGPNSGQAGANGDTPDVQLAATITADGTGVVHFAAKSFSSGGFNNTYYITHLTIEGVTGGGSETTFSGLGSCLGSGPGDGYTGLGGGDPVDPTDPGGDVTPPDDPIPTPPPDGYPPPVSGGARPFGAFNLPSATLGYWNMTAKWFTENNTVDLLNSAATAGAKLLVFFGEGERVWKTNVSGANGTYQFALWKAAVDRVKNNARAKAALDARIASGVAWACFVGDEFFQKGLRYGGTVPLAVVERMCQYIKSIWPTWRTMITVDPVDQAWWLTRHINGLDCVSSDYMMVRGDCTTWRDRCLDRLDVLNHDAILAPHYRHINAVTNGRWITPSELRHYGGIIARKGGTGGNKRTVANFGWKYDPNMYAQPGFIEALHENRDTYAADDP